jgi:tRNA(Arg) A34 adenosine deaminase TadA
MYARLAIKEASKARHRQHRLGAVLLRAGKPIALAHNHDHIHAEDMIIRRTRHLDGLDGCILLIIRVRKDGSFGIAKPCVLCTNRLIQAGVKKVIFSTNKGEFESINLRTMNSTVKYLEYSFIKPRFKSQ